MLAFTRNLGARAGVQLNYPLDNTEGFAARNSDQAFAVMGQFQRGRTDKAFKVTRANFKRYLGASAAISLDAMNEAYLHIWEAFRKGANEAVISRFEASDASVSYIDIDGATTTAADCIDTSAGGALAAYVDSTQPIIMRILHLENFNDGITIKVKADAVAGPAASKLVTLRFVDNIDGKELYSFYGSLDPEAVDDFGNSLFLPDVVSGYTDNFEIVVAEDAKVETDSPFYDAWVEENVDYYSAGTAVLTSTEIDAAINRLRYNEFEHRYFITAGEQNVLAVSGLATIAKEMNRPIIVDIPAGYTAEQAIVWVDSMISSLQSSYVHIYWTPLKALDPLNGGKAVWGTSGMQVGYRCARNANTDANGVPPLNYPIAGKEYPIDRNRITQLEFPDENTLDDLAKNGINPVLFETYNTGSNYIFTDSLTCVRKESATKLISVSEMSSQVDDWIAKYGKECLQLPIQDAIRRLSDFERALFEAILTAKWIKPSVELDGSAYVASVKPNEARPNDRVDTEYKLHYDGTLRALYAQQTISK